MRRAVLALLALLLPANSEPAALTWVGQPAQGGVLRGAVRSDVTAVALRGPDGAEVPAALDPAAGRFLVGFDRDAPAREELVATTADGRRTVFALAVAPRAWRIERVATPYHPPGFDARRPPELARIAAARATVSTLTGWETPLRWSVAGAIRGRFGAQRVYQGKPGSYHGGVDIAASTGAVVRAPATGRVVLAADHPFTLEGNLVMIDHGGGLFSSFLHLSRIDVQEGALVAAGQPIGAVGMTGRATGPHLHWGLSWRDVRLDPLLVAGPMTPR